MQAMDTLDGLVGEASHISGAFRKQHYVLKPNPGSCGRGVHFFDNSCIPDEVGAWYKFIICEFLRSS